MKTIMLIFTLFFTSFSYAKKCNIEMVQQGELSMDSTISPMKGELFITKNYNGNLPIWFEFTYEGSGSIDQFNAIFTLGNGTVIYEGLNNGKSFKLKRRVFRDYRYDRRYSIFVEIKPINKNIVLKSGEHRLLLDYRIKC